MTTTQHRNEILDRIADCDWHIAQAAAEGRRDETAWQSWEHLFQTGQYRKAAQWWAEEIQPTFQQHTGA